MINQLPFQVSRILSYSLSNHSPDIVFAQCTQQIAYSVYALQEAYILLAILFVLKLFAHEKLFFF